MNKARYRVDRGVFETSQWTIYRAQDLQTSEAVLVVERPGDRGVSIDLQHDGFLSFAETFSMNGRMYSVSEPVAGDDIQLSVSQIMDRFAVIMMALNALEAHGRGECRIGPQNFVKTSAGNHKLLLIEPGNERPSGEEWFLPIDAVYEHLDSVSQRAIFNAWGETAVAGLEHPARAPKGLYSLAALFYKELTGSEPPGGFERTVTVLDGADPLDTRPIGDLAGDSAAAYFSRCLALRPEDRFGSFEQAVLDFPDLKAGDTRDEEPRNDLIELPAHGYSRSTPVAQVGVTQTVAYLDSAKQSKIPDATEHPLVDVNAAADRPPDPAATADEDVPLFSTEGKTSRGFGKYFAFAAAAILAIAIGIWALLPVTDIPVAAQTQTTTMVAKPVVEVAPMPSATPDTPPVTEVQIQPVSGAPNSTPAEDPQPRPAQTKAQAKTVERPNTPAKAKKKVTVDDLINDN